MAVVIKSDRAIIMNYQPTLGAAAADIRRAIYASFTDRGLQSGNAAIFLSHAQKILDQKKQQLRPSIRRDFSKAMMSRALDSGQPLARRQEDLLMVASLLSS